jgi:hypothetical protein
MSGPAKQRAVPEGDEGKAGDFRIELVRENLLWTCKVSRWNTRRNKWDRAIWTEAARGISPTESMARLSANNAVKRLRLEEKRIEIVYYDRARKWARR